MKVEITRGAMIKGEPVTAGSILDIDANDARLLISSNKAVVSTAVEVEPEPACKIEFAPKPTSEPVSQVRRTRQTRTSKE